MQSFVLAILSLAVTDPAPRVVHVGMVAPDVVAVTIHEGTLELGKLVPYEAKPGDQINAENAQRTSLRRDGVEVGTLGGPAGNQWLRLPDSYLGERLDAASIKDASRWSLATGPAIDRISYKKRVIDAGQVEWGAWQSSFEYIVFLKLAAPLEAGSYKISFQGLASFEFGWNDKRTTSPAVHVSAVGFRPSDPGKRATLSCWTGDDGAIGYLKTSPELTYRVVDDATNKEVLSGNIEVVQQADEADDFSGLWGRPNGQVFNRVGGPVCSMDLGLLTAQGTYRVVVEGIGSSKPFRIADDVYDDVWKLALKGLNAHRRNVAIDITTVEGETWTRPAADDSAAVYNDARMANATFDVWQKAATDRNAPETKGGWMDAGDFDSNHNHYWASLMLLDVFDRHPSALSADDAGTSDSGNGRPDLLDEALWMIDTYLPMQRADGSVTSGIEYSEHPRTGEPSWLNTLPVYQMAPSPVANYRFAASAARAGRVLRTHGLEGAVSAREYIAAASKAFVWAETHRDDPAPDSQEDLDGARLLASCELLLAGNQDAGQAWTDHIPQLVEKEWAVMPVWETETVATYLRLGNDRLDARTREALSRTFYQTTNMAYLDGSTRKSGFGVLKNGWAPFGYGTGGGPQPGTHHVVQFASVVPDNDVFPPHIQPNRDEFVAAGVTGLAFILGHHPTNCSYVTGLETLPGVDESWTSVQNILHCDTRFTGRRAPVGVTIYGAVRPTRGGDSWPVNWPLIKEQTLHPQYELWPEYENLQEFWLWGNMMEYTIWQSVGPTIWFAAELHARDRS